MADTLTAMPELLSLCIQAMGDNKLFPLGNLSNEVHPLFARENFLVADTAYEALLPSLRLLTKILSTPQVRHYLFATWFGHNEKVGGPRDAYDMEFEAYHSDRANVTSLSSADIAAVLHKLGCLAKMVKFQVSDEYGKQKHGWCDATVPAAVPGSSRAASALPEQAENLQGVSITIVLAKFVFDPSNQPEQEPGLVPAKLALDRFTVTMILLHEVAHAANYAAMGLRQEDYFAGSKIAEAGLEIHARFLGGCYKPAADGSTEATLYEWPNRQVLQLYNYSLPVRSLESITEEPETWSLPDYFVTAMSHDWFWDWAAAKGPTAFVPEPVAVSVRLALRFDMRVTVPRTIADLFAENPVFESTTSCGRPLRARQTVDERKRSELVEGGSKATPIVLDD